MESHGRRVIAALEKNKSKYRRDIEEEARGVVRAPKKKCPIVLGALERRMYTHCANCGLRIDRHQ